MWVEVDGGGGVKWVKVGGSCVCVNDELVLSWL